MENKEKIEALLNKTFVYKGKEVCITSYKQVSGQTILFKGNKQLFGSFNNDQFEAFLNQLEEPTEKISFVQKKETITEQLQEEKQENLSIISENKTIKQSLLNTLNLLTKDKEYIPQANAICKVVNAMVNVQKTELQILEAMKKNKF